VYNYLLAKATGGQFILRLEDTDKVGFPTRCLAHVLADKVRKGP
jgi:glutamyl/glutaminyl-tRNA synthetase